MSTPLLSPGAVLASYARHSDKRQERSVLQQNNAFQEFTRAGGYRLPEAHMFFDEAKSGASSVGRDGLEQLLTFLERRPRPVQGVLLWASSRLARNVDDAAWYKSSIRRGGYPLVYVGETQLNTAGPERHILEAISEYKDAQYLADLARDVKRGMLDEAGTGHSITRVPRGYRILDRRVVIDPDYEAAVRLAWEMRAAGHSLSAIHKATGLYKTAPGYVQFFANRLYTGVFIWGGQEFPGYAPALCTPEQWARVRELDLYKEHPRRVNSPFLLSGRAFCADCKRTLLGLTQVQAGKSYRYYKCRRDTFRGGCSISIRAETLDAYATQRAQAEFVPEVVRPLYEQWRAGQESAAAVTSQRAEQLKLKLLATGRAIDNLLAVLKAGGDFPSVRDELAALEADRADVTARLGQTAVVPAALLDIDVVALCAEIQAGLVSDDEAERRLALRAVVERVEAGADRNIHVVVRRLPF